MTSASSSPPSSPPSAHRTVMELLSSCGIEQELLLIERAKVRARRAKTLRVRFVDPVATLRTIYPDSYAFSEAIGCAILRANGRVLSMRCADLSRLPELEKELANTALGLIGIDVLQQNTLREQVVCTFPLRKRARGARPFVSDVLPRRLLEMVANAHECNRSEIQMILRRHSSETALVAYATELPNKTIEPRAFFNNSRDAVRDALVHALDPQSQFVVPIEKTLPPTPPV